MVCVGDLQKSLLYFTGAQMGQIWSNWTLSCLQKKNAQNSSHVTSSTVTTSRCQGEGVKHGPDAVSSVGLSVVCSGSCSGGQLFDTFDLEAGLKTLPKGDAMHLQSPCI